MPNLNKMLKRATPELRKHFGRDQEMFDDIFNFSSDVLDDMVMLYNTGKRHREAGRNKYGRLEFVAAHDELAYTDGNEVPVRLYMKLVDMLYLAYCDGFDGVKR